MKEIPLIGSSMKALIDDADYPLVSERRWYPHRRSDGKGYYARCYAGYWGEKTHHVYLHRFLLGLKGGQKGDHWNGNGLDNRRENIRKATRALNSANSARRSGLTGYKGVSPNLGKLLAQCCGKHVGRFDTAEEAARAYDDAARQQFGAFGTYNFPLPGERSAITGAIRPSESEAAA
jgi:hypothetical protein